MGFNSLKIYLPYGNDPDDFARKYDISFLDDCIMNAIKEGKKERIQVFEGLVISYKKTGSVGALITVRKVASGVGVEKSWFVHSPNVVKIQIIKRSKVKRCF